MNKIKLIFSIIFLLLIGFCVLVSINNKKLKEQIDVSKHNINTLLLVNDTLKISNKSLLLDIYTLNNSNDSILKELNNVRNKLRIKDKEIESLHKINLEINKKDSVIIRDTNIFKNNNIFQLRNTNISKMIFFQRHPCCTFPYLKHLSCCIYLLLP